MFNYANLSNIEFEALCKDVMEKKLGVSLRRFAPGQDDGIDLTDDATKPNIVVQVKHYWNSTPAQLVSALKRELSNVITLAPHQYYICCSKMLSPHQVRELYQYFLAYMDSDRNIITIDQLDDLLRQTEYEPVLRKHHRLWNDLPNFVPPAKTAEDYLLPCTELRVNQESVPFSYNYSRLPEIWGRDPQLEQLQVFAEEDPSRFRFCVITGPAGIGKSKLVFHFGYQYQQKKSADWLVRKLTQEDISALSQESNWNTSKHLLLIIDYANEQHDLLKLLRTISIAAEAPCCKKIRLILIAREGTSPSMYDRNLLVIPEWYRRIKNESRIHQHLYLQDFIDLHGLSRKDCAALHGAFTANHLHTHPSLLDEAQVLDLIEGSVMDDSGFVRPLYALFVMDLYYNSPPTNRRWDLHHMQEQIYKRDRERWKNALSTEDCDHQRVFPALIRLLVYATIFDGWNSDMVLPDPLSWHCDVIFDAVDTSISDCRGKWFKMLTGQDVYSRGTPVLTRLTPDMVGEFFALKELSHFRPREQQDWNRLMISRLPECREFFVRAIQDFGNNEILIDVFLKLFESMIDLLDDGDDSAHQSFAYILEVFFQNYKGNEKDQIFVEIRSTLKRYTEKYRDCFVSAAELVLLFHENRPHMGREAKSRHFSAVDHLHTRWPDSPKIVCRYISFLGDIVSSAIGAHDLGFQDENIAKFECLHPWTNSPEEEIRRAFIPALCDLITAAYSVKDFDRALHLESEFLHRVMNHPTEEISLEFLNHYDSVIIELAKQRSRRPDPFLEQRLETAIGYYLDVINREDSPSFNFIWTHVSNLAKLTKNLFLYENPPLDSDLDSLDPLLKDLFLYMLRNLKRIYGKYRGASQGNALSWHASRTLDMFCDSKSSAIPYSIKAMCILNSPG